MTAHMTAIGSVVPLWAGGGGGVGPAGDACFALATFVNADLVAGVYTFAHGLAGQFVNIQVYDNANQVVQIDDVDLTAAGSADLDLTSFGTLIGTWRVIAVGECT